MKRLLVWLMIAFVGVVILSIFVRTAMLVYTTRQQTQGAAAQESLKDARAIADWAAARWDRPSSDLRVGLGALARVAGARVWLVQATGMVRVDTHTEPSWEGVRVTSAALEAILTGEERVTTGPSPWLESALSTAVPIYVNHKVAGAVFLFLPASQVMGPSIQSTLVWSGIIALAVSTLVALAIARRISRPVELITRFAGELGDGKFGSEIRVSSFTEVSKLAATLTQVSRQLQSTFSALVEERSRLEGILLSMHEGVIAVNAKRQIIVVNDAAVRLLRLKERPDLPEPLGAAPIPARLRAALLKAARGERTQLNMKGRGESDLLAVCMPVATPDGTAGAVAVVQDLSEVMRLQRMRENLVADVTHELRGPLANLSIVSEALGDGTIAWEDRHTYVQLLQEEVGRLIRLSKDVLDLARMDAGTLSIDPEPLDLAGLAQRLCQQQENRAAAAGVALIVDIPTGLQVKASSTRMEQVLHNLLENALRHTQPGGQVILRAAPEQDWVRLMVADTGSGIPEEHLPYIFDRFYKVDPARTRSDGGTGLGLAVVRQLVELQGGTVEVSSQEGVGSIFTVVLPAA